MKNKYSMISFTEEEVKKAFYTHLYERTSLGDINLVKEWESLKKILLDIRISDIKGTNPSLSISDAILDRLGKLEKWYEQ